ncbi:MAG: hypothetical protein KIT87_26990 [Anaerolineae bacterium]|nr:hypothetical protein [Anaerolineae bacterium]
MNTQDQFLVKSPVVRGFIASVQATMAHRADPAVLVEQIRPAFAHLLAMKGWLPPEFTRPHRRGGMGGGIGQYLLFVAGDKSLSLSALVVPGGVSTPVHDHLAWGLVGLYRGNQKEEVYHLEGGDLDAGTARLTRVEERPLRPGDFYSLLPPDGDIHRVTTTSRGPSISIHMLGSDIGCVVRHRFDPASSTVTPFKSGYSNAACETLG